MSHDPQSPTDAADFDDDPHFMDDDDFDDDGNFKFDCPQYYDVEADGWFCPLAGTEECDGECKE